MGPDMARSLRSAPGAPIGSPPPHPSALMLPLPASLVEEDDDAHIARLAEQIAHSMLDEDDDKIDQNSLLNSTAFLPKRGSFLPQTTMGPNDWLYGECNDRNIRQARKAHAQVLKNKGVELLYAEIMRLRLAEKMRAIASANAQLAFHRPHPEPLQKASTYYNFSGEQVADAYISPEPHNITLQPPNMNAAQWDNPNVYRRSIPGVRNRHPAPTFHNSSGMRAVFLGSSGSRESGGTGVFLPRGRTGNHNYNSLESKRKQTCSTVLLPSRIVQALNLNVEDTLSGAAVPSPIVAGVRKERPLPTQYWRGNHRKAGVLQEDYGAVYPSCSPLQEAQPSDISLPTEWTY